MSPELKIFLLAMSPIVELRGAIPVGMGVHNMPVYSVFLLSVLGNLIPAGLILFFLEPVSRHLSARIRFFKKFFGWLFAKTRQKHQAKFAKWEKFALLVLVAIPLPFTGAWTGALCAFLFGIRFRQAFPLIALGVLIAGVIVLILTSGAIKII